MKYLIKVQKKYKKKHVYVVGQSESQVKMKFLCLLTLII